MRPEPLTPEQARDPHEAWSNGWSNGFASAREATDEMVERFIAHYRGLSGLTLPPIAVKQCLTAAFQDKHEPQEGTR